MLLPIYTRTQLESLLHVSNDEKIYLPNSIFKELQKAMIGHGKNKSSKHIPFAYAYVFLISYLWRYAKFGCITHDYDYTEVELKRLLGVNGVSKGFDYITKKNGVLEQIGYIRKESDYPVTWQFSKKVINSHGATDYLEFTMHSDIKEMLPTSDKSTRNRKVNFPLRGYYGCLEHELEGYEDGYLFEIHEVNNETVRGTHEVSFETFLFCMSNDEIGLEGFYIYQYIYYQSFGGKRFWNCPQKSYESEFGIDIDMVKTKFKVLEEYGMITNTHEMMIMGLPSDKVAKANAYCANKFMMFREAKATVKKRQVISYKKACELYGDSFCADYAPKIEEFDLPF